MHAKSLTCVVILVASVALAQAQQVRDVSETLEVFQLTRFSTHTEVSIGLQAGGQTYRQIVFFEDAAAYERFTSGSFEFEPAD